MGKKSLPARWRANFFNRLLHRFAGDHLVRHHQMAVRHHFQRHGLAAVLLPKYITHQTPARTRSFGICTTEPAGIPNAGQGPVLWYWSLVALVIAVLLISVIGRLARNYFGRKSWSGLMP